MNEEPMPITVEELLRIGKLAKKLSDEGLVIDISGCGGYILLHGHDVFLRLFPTGWRCYEELDERGWLWKKYEIYVDGIRFCASEYTFAPTKEPEESEEVE